MPNRLLKEDVAIFAKRRIEAFLFHNLNDVISITQVLVG